MINNKECPQAAYGNDEYDLHSVVITTGYYGSCETSGKTAYHTHHSLKTFDDRTPLLNGSRPLRAGKCMNIRIFSLGVLFIGGVTIGSYLLYLQGSPWRVKLVLDIVNREEWDAEILPTGRTLNHSNVFYVLLYHTSSKNCYNFAECKAFLQNMQNASYQIDKSDIPFNFLIGGDGRTYEGRGWSIESKNSPIRSDYVMSIALIGDFTENNPSVAQLSGTLALLAEMEFQKKVTKNYSMLGISYTKNVHHDGAALFALTSKWKRWDEVLTIY